MSTPQIVTRGFATQSKLQNAMWLRNTWSRQKVQTKIKVAGAAIVSQSAWPRRPKLTRYSCSHQATATSNATAPPTPAGANEIPLVPMQYSWRSHCSANAMPWSSQSNTPAGANPILLQEPIQYTWCKPIQKSCRSQYNTPGGATAGPIPPAGANTKVLLEPIKYSCRSQYISLGANQH